MAGRCAAVDLTAWLLRLTPPRPLVVTSPGGTATRLAVERAARVRGWQAATNPAEANILVIAGPALEPYAGRLWEAMPAPRARVDVAEPDEVPDALDAAVRVLRDADQQREQAPHPAPTEHEVPPSTQPEHHGGHGEHGHDMGGMEMPGGIPMADRAEDRDSLKLDQLHVPLGPALPLWPAGLIVHTLLQGDVIQEATVEVLTPVRDSFWTSQPVARQLDSSACLLDLAGWTDAAAVARRLRDDALDGLPVPAVQNLAKRVRRSRTLRWLLTGIGTVPGAGDALTRLYRWLDVAEDAAETPWTVDALPELLNGTELATARLIVASLHHG
jgi:hypothetical protein